MFLNIDKQYPVAEAVVDNEGHRLSYGQLVKEVENFAPGLDERSIIFCLCRNTAGSLVGYLGMVEKNTVPLMLSDKIENVLLVNLIVTYKPGYLWVPENVKSQFDYESVYNCLGYVLLKTEFIKYPIHSQLELLMTTSGSTGSPKLVRYKKGNLEANARNVAKAFGWTKAERPVCDLGMQYTMGLNVINTHLYVGACVLLTTFNLLSGDFWEYIKKEQATNFTGVPFSYDILAKLHFDKMDLPYLTTLSQGGGKLTEERFSWLADYARKTHRRFLASFGTTETSARMCVLPAELAKEKTGSIGKAIPEGELFLIDSEGKRIMESIAEGELCYQGPNVTMGYAICREDLEKGDEWKGVYRTGDLARRDMDGCYYITGRLSRFLKLLSYRVSLDQCECLIREKFGIDCACSGSDRRMDIYITETDKAKAVQEFVCRKTGLFRNLFRVVVIDEIPRNESGKILYKKLN